MNNLYKNTLNNIEKTITTNPETLQFLHIPLEISTTSLDEFLALIVHTDKPLTENVFSENAIYCRNLKSKSHSYYFNVTQWNNIYLHIAKNDLAYGIFNSSGRDMSHAMDDSMRQETRDILSVKNYFLRCRSNIVKNAKKGKYLNILQNLLIHPDASVIIYNNIQTMINKQLRIKDPITGKREVLLPLVSLSILIGIQLIESIIIEHPLLRKFLHFYKQKQQRDRITDHDIQVFNAYIEAIYNQDKDQVDTIYDDLETLIPDFELTQDFRDLLSDYMFSFIHKQYKKDNVPFNDLKNFFDKHVSEVNRFHDMDFNMKETVLKAISIYLDEFAEPLSKKIEWVLRRTIQRDSPHKTVAYVEIHPHIIALFLESFSENKPYLIAENKSYLSNYEMKDELLEIIYNNKRDLIHENTDSTIQILPECYLNKTTVFHKLTADIGFLDFFLQHFAATAGNQDFIYVQEFAALIYDFEPLALNIFAEYPAELELFRKVIKFGYDLNHDTPLLNQLSVIMRKEKFSYDKALFPKINLIYEKIRCFRLILRGILNECVLFSRFKYITCDEFLDYIVYVHI